MSEHLSILNENFTRLEGPSLLHKLIEWQRDTCALDCLKENGQRKQYSYHELRRCVLSVASAVQGTLRTAEAESKDYRRIVPVLVSQSPGLYISILAILEADAAFCPINLDSPLDRIKFVVGDVSAGVVITTRGYERLMTWQGGPRVILVDEFPAVPRHHGSPNAIPPEPARPPDLAYVMYTSGSSGTPKGVAVSHLAASQSLLAHDKHIPRFKRFLQFAAPSFDVSVFEIFFPLFRRATLVGCSRVQMLNDLTGTINQLEVDGVELTPTVVSSLLQRRSNVPGLKCLLTIGEMLTRPVVDEFGKSGERDGILYALYGPTEAAIHCTVNPHMRSDARCADIGIPFDTVSAFIASAEESDNQNGEIRILPVGNTGELVLGGPQIAQCYLNRAEQNKAAFVNVRGQRAYRTGDKARITSRGIIEILGRMTTGQAKLRGQRAELGEIEEAVYRHAGVRVAVASVLNGVLVVFVLSQEPEMIPEDVLKTCSSWLPAFMLPSEVITLKEFPYMPSGKVDKRKLEADFESRKMELNNAPEQWKTETEDVVAKAIRDVLGVEVGSSTRLAGIGLDSLAAIRLASALRSSSNDVSVVNILKAENVPALAHACEHFPTKQQTTERHLAESTDFEDLIQQWSKRSQEHVDLDEIEYILPCTPLQDAMISETATEVGTYKNRVTLQLSTTNVKEAQRAMQILANKNPLLRTGFIPLKTDHSTYSQIVRKELPVSQIEVVEDFRDDAATLQGLSLLHPLRIQLRHKRQEIQALLQIHHATYDAWSLELLLDDLETILSNKPCQERPSFRSVMDWHRKENSGDNIWLSMKYWEDHLSQLEILQLPCYETANNVERKLNVASVQTSIGTQETMTTANTLFVSPQSIFQAAFAIILSSYIGSQDVCFGTVFSGRTVPIREIENIVGPCLATLPTRLDLETVSTLREIVQRLNSINRKHLEYSSLPLRLIKQACGIEPGQALFDSLLVWQQTLHGFEQRRDEVLLIDSVDYLEFNLTLEVIPEPNKITFKANYQRAIFPPRQVDFLLRQLEELVSMIIKFPEQPLDIARGAFADSLLSSENPNPRVDLVPKTLASTVEQLALSLPERIAIKFATRIEADVVDVQQVSYRELNLQANKIAHHLISCEVLPDDLICIIMDKSVDLYISILATIKSGVGYLPITPDTPLDRIRQILSQANTKLVLCHSSLGIDLKPTTSAPIIFIDQLNYSILQSENPPLRSTAEHLAYCVFTSGSTGTPKGVLVTRGNLMSNLEFLAELYPGSGSHLQSEHVKLLQSCSQAFDVSVFEIFFTWNIGACLCSAVKNVLFRDIELAINTLQVTHLSLTPTVAALVNPRNVPAVKFLVTAGEAVTEKVFIAWANNGLWQGYGPSETTNICTIRPNIEKHHHINNIGPPLKNTSAFILHPTDKFSLVPRGGEGEFCFGGAQVGRGYLDPAQAVGKFIDHPSYGRIYRSGDYGRLLPDGSLSFSGRKDGQVKLRGQRIELGEINNLLLRSPMVRDCVTLVIEGKSLADQRLVTFLTPRHSSTLEFTDLEIDMRQIETLFSSLCATLPTYMVPSSLIPVSSMPWTAQGKIDSHRLVQHYRSLPIRRLDRASHKPRADIEPQWSEIEEKIARTVATTVDVPLDAIGPETSFFSLGIDSVSAISLARALRDDLGLNLQISDILKYSSVSRLAYQAPRVANPGIGTPGAESNEFGLISKFLPVTTEDFVRDGRAVERITPCTPLQEAMLSADETSSHDSYKNQLVLEIKVSIERFKSAWARMVERHEILRTCFLRTDHPRFAYAQVVLKEFIPSWEMREQLDNDQDDSISNSKSTRFSTSKYQPPYSIKFRNLPESTQVLLSLHHAVYDAIAMSILFEEIEIALQNRVLQNPVSFAPFLEYVSSLKLEEADTHWDKLLSGFKPIEIIPEELGASTGRNSVTRMKSESNLSWIETQVKTYNTSFLSVCQASWVSLLSIYLQEGDICIGTVVSGRTVPVNDIDRLVAPCFNTIPVRLKGLNNLSFMEGYRELQSQSIDSMAFQLTPLRRIQSRLNTEGTKLFDTLLILQQSARPLDPSIWSIVEDEGAMDVPIVIEIVPQRDCDTLNIILHSRQEQLSDKDAALLLSSFDSILKKSLINPRHSVSSAIPYDKSNPLIRRKVVSRRRPTKPESNSFETMSPIQSKIRDTIAVFTEIPRDKIRLETSIYRLGLDSISAVQVAACLRKEGLQVLASDVLQHPNVERLTSYLAEKQVNQRRNSDLRNFRSFHEKHYMNIHNELGLSSQRVTIRPCTLIQCGMLAQTIHADGMQYINSFYLELELDVSLSKMRAAWDFAMSQHEMLRTGFMETGDSKYPFAMITYSQDDIALPWSVDVENVVGEKPDNIESLLRRPWKLDVSCINAVTRIKFIAHHAIYDAQSLEIILCDVANFYSSTSLPSLSNQVSISPLLGAILDAADQNTDNRKRFWQEEAKLAVSHFPDLTPLHVQSTEVIVKEISSKLSVSQLERLCRQQEVSILAAGQAAWGRLLSAYVGDPYVTFGLTLSGRSTIGDLDQVAFPTIVTLPVGCHVVGSNADLLDRIMQCNSQLHEHQFTPLTSIQKWTGHLGGKLFDTLLAYQKIGTSDDVAHRPWKVVEEEARVEYGLSIELQPTESGTFRHRLTCRTNLVPAEQANIMLRQFDALLLDTLENPENQCASLTSFNEDLLSITPAAEPTLLGPVELLHQFVEMQAEMIPHRTALEFTENLGPDYRGPISWNFQVLNWEGNRVANLLLDRGANVGDLVAICFNKCPEASFAILGILKAGCAFVAIDPNAPPDRIRFIVEDSRVTVILTAGYLTKRFKEIFDVNDGIEVIDTGCLGPGRIEKSPSLQREISPGDTCYCLYTSGTTGTPKGCEITHENAVQAMMSFTKLFNGRWTEKSKWLQFASFHFDVSVLEQFWPWSVGICVASAPRDLIFQDMPETIRRLGITHIDLTPSLARLLHPDDVPSLTKGVFITGGEQLKQEILDTWGDCHCIYNGYGPTEATIGVTMYPRVPKVGKPSNIGPQFSNVGSYVFRLGTAQPVLRGAVGELCVSGKLVGKGYLNRPELTNERFPHLEDFGERVYRTGDLVRVLHNGSFLFLGRADDQVKLRGQRLELGEINQVIKKHVEGLQDVVTLVVQHKNQQKEQLVTFFVPNPGYQRPLRAGEPTIRIRDACRRGLPGYMVPTYIIYLDRLPLSANNKVEVKQLAKRFSDMSLRDLKDLETVTRVHKEWTTQEQAVLESLGEILKVDKGVLASDGNIFEFGIDSISVIAFTRSLQRAGYKKATLSVVMQNTSIDSLVGAIASNLGNDQTSHHKALIASQNITAFAHRNIVAVATELKISPSDIECLAPCTPAQEGMIYRFLSSPRALYFMTFKFNLNESVDDSRLRTAFGTVACRLQILRTKLVLTNDGCAQVVLKEANIDWQSSHLWDNSNKALENYTEDRCLQTADVEKSEALANPWRVLVTKNGSMSTLYLTMFHGLYDGISFPKMLRLIYQQYHMACNIDWGQGFHSVLPYGPLKPLSDAKTFWKNVLDGWGDYPVPKLVGQVQERDFRVPSNIGTRGQLESLRNNLGVTYQSLLQAAMCIVIQELLGSNITFGLVTSGRAIDFDGAENVIGPLLNTIPFHVTLTPEMTWKDLIRACHKFNMGMLPYQHTALRDIQNWCSAGKPLFDILFVFQQENSDSLSIEGFWEAIPTDPVADYAIAFEAQLLNDGTIALEIVGQTDVLDGNAISYLRDKFEAVLQAMRQLDQKAFSPSGGSIKQIVEPAQEQTRIDIPQQEKDISVFKWTTEAEQIRQEIEFLAGSSDIDERTSIFELGLDSIDMIKLVSRLKARGIHITVNSLLRSQTIENMLNEISKNPHSSTEARATIRTYEQQLTSYLLFREKLSAETITVLPVTPLQEGLVAEMVASGYARYFNHEVFRVPRYVHIDKLEGAWNTVISKNDIFRTRFLEIDSVEFPMSFAQAITRTSKSYWNCVPLIASLDLDAMIAEVIQGAIEAAKVGELLQLRHINHGEDHYFVLSISHALYDGWSLQALHDDIWKAYHGDVVTRPDIRPTLELILNGGQPDEVNFWKASLSSLQRSKFPKCQHLDVYQNIVHRRERVSSNMLKDVQRFCRSVGTSLQTVGQTAWAFLLATLLKRMDVVFGMVLSCRDSEEANELMFPLMNTVAIRPVIHGSIIEMLRHMQDHGNSIRRYQHFPLRKAQALAGVHDGHLFDSLFIYQGRARSLLSEQNKLYESVSSVSELEFVVCVEMEIVDDNLIWRTACKNSVLSDAETKLLLDNLDHVLGRMMQDPTMPTIVVSANGVSICGMEPFHEEATMHEEQDLPREALTSEMSWTGCGGILRGVLAEVARCPAEQINKDQTLFNLGLDSISAIKVSSILKRHSINLTVSEMTGNTMEGMIEIINENSRKPVRPNGDIWRCLANIMKVVDCENIVRSTGLDPSEVEDVLPVMAGQMYMIARSQLSAGTLFVSRFTYLLANSYVRTALENAWRVLVRAHPILRTIFAMAGGTEPLAVQIVKKENNCSIIREAISSSSADMISLTTPLILSIEERGQDQLLHLDIHHALYDGISLPLLLKNLQELCARPRESIPVEARFRQFVARSVYRNGDRVDGQHEFWTKYLRKSTTLKPKQDESPGRQDNMEIFEPNNPVRAVTVVAQQAGVSVDAILLAAFSKEYSKLVETRNKGPPTEASSDAIPQEVIFGLYLANRAPYGEDLSTLIAPTLNLLPIRIDTSKDLIKIAQEVQSDLQQLRSANIVGTSLAEIYEWTGVQVNCFVNILKTSVPDFPFESHEEFELKFRNQQRRRRAEIVEKQGDEQLRAEAEKRLGEAQKAYLPSIDVEMRVTDADRGTWLDIGVFAPCEYLDIGDASGVIEGIKLQLGSLD